ncbi:MAG: hypothetical protein K1Y02_17910 [Candidatus Hydrogenedentes bacterium]|nr:hypothetical protein [Candidatus Hydrogenedentota bacterium]
MSRTVTRYALLSLLLPILAYADAVFDLGAAKLTIDTLGYATLNLSGEQAPWPKSEHPIVTLGTSQEVLLPESVAQDGPELKIQFKEGAYAVYRVTPQSGFAVFELIQLEVPKETTRVNLFSLGVPENAELMTNVNACRSGSKVVTLSAAEPNIHAFSQTLDSQDGDSAGCSHTITPTTDAKSGIGAARFTATSGDKPAGWSVSGRYLPRPLDLTGITAIRAWVNGDGQGELLKFQLYDGSGGYRDTYLPIDFTGWRQVTLTEIPYNTIKPEHISALNVYYNGLPANATVTCLIDRVEAIIVRNGIEEAVLLEDFEPEHSRFFTKPQPTLSLETSAAHGLLPARFGLLVSSDDTFYDVMQQFENHVGLPCPAYEGRPIKTSPLIKQSYLFITSFSEPEYDTVVNMARRGGFGTILILQDSWTRSTGHYEVNDKAFPGGIETLARTVQRFKKDGFRVGFHFLGASIYPNDPYLTPIPDPRLVRDHSTELAEDVTADSDFVPTIAAPDAFPAEDGGYMGYGTIIQIGDELIAYGSRSMESPLGFKSCQRGYFGTAPAPHTKGETIRHLKRTYGYFLHDMDSTLFDEVTSNMAKVANACDVDMLYFDGSEWLQGEHWYYNARLIKGFYDKLTRKDILLQASSYSHYSWHMLSRSASADGHDDLKAYLDERSGWFDAFKRDAMPLDIGWYYGYDPTATPDMFEYILGATIGYNSSMSFQVSCGAAANHPFTGAILDLISRYEKLRLSGRVPEDMRERFRVEPILAGVKQPEERESLREHRREFRLVGTPGHETFQRVDYQPWHTIDPAYPQTATWSIHVPKGPAKVGVQFRVVSTPWTIAGPSYRSADAVLLEGFDDLAPYLNTPAPSTPVTVIEGGQGGATLDGVSQRLAQFSEAKEGGACAEYTATSTRPSPDGWSVVTKAFDPPLDLSWFKAIGFWLRGDGKGGQFKLQLTDGEKATDWYIANDYEGWRYQQLPRPEIDPMNYGKVRTLSFYYNGLPANTGVTCAIDDVKALRAVDTQSLSNPWIEIDGARIPYAGTLTAGQYAFLYPGDAWLRYGPAFVEAEIIGDSLPALEISEGDHTIRVGAESQTTASMTRVVLDLPERYEIPMVQP